MSEGLFFLDIPTDAPDKRITPERGSGIFNGGPRGRVHIHFKFRLAESQVRVELELSIISKGQSNKKTL
jgi:hypothetical protein